MEYRREVDGLRALAVLPVILFHAGFANFSGGFVGVDVFFVISGYLITSIILPEIEAGNFSLLRFYERRARRILPALFLVLVVCLPCAWLWLLPNDFREFGKSLSYVSVFLSNVFLYRQSGYFDTVTELKPLLHTWSLAVEEQYYVIFPLLLALLFRRARRFVLPALIGLALFSLGFAEYKIATKPAEAFFLLPSRMWELLIGASIAWFALHRPLPTRGGEAASLLGVAAVLYAVFAFDKTTPFPGLWALLPTLGAALIIVYATPVTWVGRVLGSRAFVGVGLISYSAYLWHQPLFAFARQRSLSEPEAGVLLVLALAALILAYGSWRWVERPFRQGQKISKRTLLWFSLIGSLALAGAGSLIAARDGFRHRLPPNLLWESLSAKVNTQGNVCNQKPLAAYPGLAGCEFGDVGARQTVVLYGDSHAQAISEELHKRLLATQRKGLWVAIEGCSVVPQIYDRRALYREGECERKFAMLQSLIKASAQEVVVASRWTWRLYPIPGVIDRFEFVNDQGMSGRRVEYNEFSVRRAQAAPSFAAEDKRAALRYLVEGLLATGAKVHLIYPIPETGWEIARVNARYYASNGRVLDRISLDHAAYLERNRFVLGVFDEFAGRSNFLPVRPERVFCNTLMPGRCVAQYDGQPFYYDDDHLSDLGARKLIDLIYAAPVAPRP